MCRVSQIDILPEQGPDRLVELPGRPGVGLADISSVPQRPPDLEKTAMRVEYAGRYIYTWDAEYAMTSATIEVKRYAFAS